MYSYYFQCAVAVHAEHFIAAWKRYQLWVITPSSADADATLWVAIPDGLWTRFVGAGVNPNIAPSKEARRNAPADRSSTPLI
jgi:hypothetical protein